MRKRIATIVLNRNLPSVTDRLVESLLKHDADLTDIYVVESGSDEGNLSKYCSWQAKWAEAVEHGLRTARGFNFGLSKLLSEGKYQDYDYFFLLTNDVEFEEGPVLAPLLGEMDKHNRVGLLCPCSRSWGEREFFKGTETRYIWNVMSPANLLRREFIDSIRKKDGPGYMDFVFDGENFRGYGTEIELISKGYINDWATGITNAVWAFENEEHLQRNADSIKTETYEENVRLFIEEGLNWIHKKYGFNNFWAFNMYAKVMYEDFFVQFPELIEHRI